jgi:hypothetical protein
MVVSKFTTACLLLVPSAIWAQSQVDPAKVPIPVQHYAHEYLFDQPADLLPWSKQPKGISASFASTDILYMRREVPLLPQEVWRESGWRGERLNRQILVWSPDSIAQIRF